MEKLATIHAELTDEGVTVKISGEAPAVVAVIGQIIVQGMNCLKNDDRNALQGICAICLKDDAKGYEFITKEFAAEVASILLLKRSGTREC